MATYGQQSDFVLNALRERGDDAESMLGITRGLVESVRGAITDAVNTLTAMDIGFDASALMGMIGPAPTFEGTRPTDVPYEALSFVPGTYTGPATPTQATPYSESFAPASVSIDAVGVPTAEYAPPAAPVLGVTVPSSGFTPPSAVAPTAPDASVTVSPVAASFTDPSATAPTLPTPTTSVSPVSVSFTDPSATAPTLPSGLDVTASASASFTAPSATVPVLPTIDPLALSPESLTFTPPTLDAPTIPTSETIDVSGINVTYVPPTAPAEVLPSASDVAIGAIEWDAIFERAASQQLRASTAEIQAANSGAALRGMAVPSVVSAGMLSTAQQRAMDRVSLLAETNAVEFAKSRREDIITLAKMGIENYVAQWEKQIQSEAERRAYAELASRFKFDQAKHNLALLQLGVEYYISTWKAKVESELARLQYAQYAIKWEYDQAALNVDAVVKLGGLQVNLYEAVTKLGLDSELAKLQYAQFDFKQQFDVGAQNADSAIKLGGLGVQVYETQSKTQLEAQLAKLQFAQFEFKQAYDRVALTVDSETKLAGLDVQIYTAEVKAELDAALARLQYAQFQFKQSYDTEALTSETAIKAGGLAVQTYSEQVKAALDAERIRIASLDQDVKNLIAVAGQDADAVVKVAGIAAQARGDYLRVESALEGTKVSRAEALSRVEVANMQGRSDFGTKVAQINQQGHTQHQQTLLEATKLALASVEMADKIGLQKAVEDQNNRYKTAETQARVYGVDGQVYAAKAVAHVQLGELMLKATIDPARIEAEFNLKKTEMAVANSVGQLVDLVQVYAQLTNALFSASDVSLAAGTQISEGYPFKYNPQAGEVVFEGL